MSPQVPRRDFPSGHAAISLTNFSLQGWWCSWSSCLLAARPSTTTSPTRRYELQIKPYSLRDNPNLVVCVLWSYLMLLLSLIWDKSWDLLDCISQLNLQGDNDGLAVLFVDFNFRVPACCPADVPILPYSYMIVPPQAELGRQWNKHLNLKANLTMYVYNLTPRLGCALYNYA